MVLCLGLLGCLGRGLPITAVAATPASVPAPDQGLRAAAREIDITPPPGLPLYGYSSEGVKRASGYWLRLQARIIVLDDGGGRRIALVQLDLGASSALLHRKLASAVAEHGIGPQNLLMAATHTHGGPGGFFGHRFYNRFVGARSAFYPDLVAWLVSRISQGIDEAVAALEPARLAVAQARVSERASFNRSYDAWRHTYDDYGKRLPDDSVDRRLTLIRIDADRVPAAPLAVFSIFGVHGTSMKADYPNYHGDVHGAAARMIATRIEQRHGVRDVVAATANGAEGDVSPGADPERKQGMALTLEVAAHIADAALEAFVSLDGKITAREARHPKLDWAYREVSLRGAGTERGRLCQVASLGAPQLAGSEEGRGPLYGFLGMYEGATRTPSGCDAAKIKIGGFLQNLVINDSEYPDVVPFQVLALGDALTLAAVPGEPTTEVGRAIVARMSASGRPGLHAVVGLSNGYSTYYTMPEEFLAQHYEGGATLYGPYQGVLAAEQLGWLAKRLGQPGAVHYRKQRVFEPGEATRLWPDRTCDSASWEAGDLEVAPGTVSFSWSGLDTDELCTLPRVEVRCGGRLLRDAGGYEQSDDGFPFEVTRCGSRWRATWSRHASSTEPCRIVVLRDGAPLESPPFHAEAPR